MEERYGRWRRQKPENCSGRNNDQDGKDRQSDRGLCPGYGIELLKSFLKQNKLLTAVYMDLDGLKEINDSKGHSVGDVYLKTFAEEMKKNLKKDELLIRFGGMSF